MKPFDVILKSRENFIKLISALSLEQVNKVPEKMTNNIAWNFGHCVASEQLLCYHFSDNAFTIDSDIINKYKKGTKPEGPISQEELDLLKKLALQSVNQLKADYERGLFTHFNTYTTSFGIELTSIETAIQHVVMHDGLHLGYAMALRKLVV